MRFWLITVGEPLPMKGNRDRLFRTGLLAQTLSRRGHDVLWWTSTFDHFRKQHWFEHDADVAVDEHLRLRLLHGPGYRKNISLRRVADHCTVAWKFARAARRERKPDAILCSLPTLELCAAATSYGRRESVPVVLDARDMWPDILANPFPSWARPLARAALFPMVCQVRTACRQATALTGITPPFVDWALGYAGRTRTDLDRDFPLACSVEPPAAETREKWHRLGIGLAPGEFIVCFFGSIGSVADIGTVIRAAAMLQRQKIPVRFILCGRGDHLDRYRQESRDCPTVLFPGWVGAADIAALMEMASAGLAPYYCTTDYMMTVSNKVIEYLSAGLPVISSLKGSYLDSLLSAEGCGLFYDSGHPDELAGLVTRLYNNPDLRRGMASQSGALFQRRFSADLVFGQMADYLETVGRGDGNAQRS